MFHTTTDPSVQERYARCVLAPPTRFHIVTCILDYLLHHASDPLPPPSVEHVYLLPVVASRHSRNILLVALKADRCSLGYIAAVASLEGLAYEEAQRLLDEHRVELHYLAPPDGELVIDYWVLRSILSLLPESSRSASNWLIGYSRLRDAVKRAFVPRAVAEERCEQAF